MFVQLGRFLYKKYVNDTDGYAADLYHDVYLFIECLEGYS
jgi:hypothetical protein